MKDNEIRGIVLQKYYEKRRESMFTPKPEDFIILHVLTREHKSVAFEIDVFPAN